MNESADPRRPETVAQVAWTEEPVRIDGRLDDPVWQRATLHPLSLPADGCRHDGDITPQEAGTARFAWDRGHFYAAFEFTDRDIVQECDADQQQHYLSGDLAELFLKPASGHHYWEFYATPTARKTAFFFPGRGRLGLQSNFVYQSGLQVAAQVNGTVNDWQSDDHGWTAEMAIPLKELAAAGIPLTPGQPWTVLVGRYNYGRHLTTYGPELSSFPHLPESAFHRHESYAPIHLLTP